MDILALQEPKHPFHVFQNMFPDFRVICSENLKTTNSQIKGGSILLIRLTTEYLRDLNPLITNSTLNICGATVLINKTELTILASYFRNANKTELRHFNAILNKIPGNFVNLGDMNAKHISWNRSGTNYTGKALYKLLKQENLTVLNNTYLPTSTDGESTTTIDLIITNMKRPEDCEIYYENMPHFAGIKTQKLKRYHSFVGCSFTPQPT